MWRRVFAVFSRRGVAGQLISQLDKHSGIQEESWFHELRILFTINDPASRHLIQVYFFSRTLIC